ncbi:hypothetical protein BREVNS_1925 [Brevinematales bacterium NS]|nr:hypothetical protein BREVNS_1925 [Brevinematales bacterium NS]
MPKSGVWRDDIFFLWLSPCFSKTHERRGRRGEVLAFGYHLISAKPLLLAETWG